MSDASDIFYHVFWVIPTMPLPLPGDIAYDGEPLPEPVLVKRDELQRALATLDLHSATDIRDAVGFCDQYVRSLRAAQAVWDGDGQATWSSAIIDHTSAIPLTFEEPMALVLEAALLMNLGSIIATTQTPECISESAQCFCQAAGLVDFILSLEDQISTQCQTDVPAQFPELAPRVLQALVDMTLAMAQQLAIVKAALHFDEPYSESVIQKLHSGCHSAYNSFESAVVRSCYNASPKRAGCGSLVGFATVFSRLHFSAALAAEAYIEFENGDIGAAIGYLAAALRQLHTRQSMRDVGLPPLDASVPSHVGELINSKRTELQTQLDAWVKDNDSIYFATVPSEDAVLAVELPRALIMNPERYDLTTRLGSVRMFRETTVVPHAKDAVVPIDADADNESEGPRVVATSTAAPREDSSYGSSSSDAVAAESDPVKDAELLPATRVHTPDLTSPSPTGTSKPPILTARAQPPPFASARSTRRMATRVQPQKSSTTRNLLTQQDSLVMLNLHDEQLKRYVTEEALAAMRKALASGQEVYRFAKEMWKKEVLKVNEESLTLVRRKGFGLLSLSKQHKIPWSTVHAFQHELLPVSQLLQLLAPRGKRMTSILVIAGRGDKVGPTEIALPTPEENACAVACLQAMLIDKRGSHSG